MATIHDKMTAIGNAIRAKTGKSGLLTLDLMASEISSISTGAELNFEVVGGTTQPNNPKNNTIWVNTSTPITGYGFGTTSNEPIWNGNNIMSNPYAGTMVSNGITFTDNKDGTVTANGTQADTSYYPQFALIADYSLPAGHYYASLGNSNNNCFMLVWNVDQQQTIGRENKGVEFVLNTTTKIHLIIEIAGSVSNVVSNPKLINLAGMVWIQTGASSSVSFNALAKNGIQVYPIYAKQSINGGWANKDMKIYQNGELKETTLNVVPNPTDYGSTVWKGYCTSSSSNPSISVSSTSTSMTFKAYKNNGVSAAYVPVDITGFNKLTIAGSYTVPNSAYGANLGISVGMFASPSGSMATGYYHSGAKDDSTTTIAEKSYDISGLSGIYYFEVRATNYASSSDLVKNPTVNLTKVKFE